MKVYQLHRKVLVLHILLTSLLTGITYYVLISAWINNTPHLIVGMAMMAIMFTCGIYPWIRLVSHWQACRSVVITYEPKMRAVTYTNQRVHYEFYIDDIVEMESVSPNRLMNLIYITTLTYDKIWVKGITPAIRISSMLRACELINAIKKSPICKCYREDTFWSDLES
jgi:hypothetical protein